MKTMTMVKKQRLVLVALFVLILIMMGVGAGLGASSLSFSRIFPTLFGQGTFKEEFILFSIRLPRIIVTVLAGMALALSGSILQGVTRNDLADPGLLGINTGAGMAVAVYFLFFPIEAGVFAYLLPVVAFAGAFVASALIYLFSYDRQTGLQPVRLVLVGVCFSMAMSGLMVVLVSSASREKVDFIYSWLAGGIWGSDWPFILALLPWLIVLIPVTLFKTKQLNLLNLGETVAIGTGVRVERDRMVLLAAAVALAASAVSITGSISFIGLMAPHIARSLVGPRNQLFIPVAILTGGWLLLVADTIGRNLFPPDGIAAGIMVALIGAPYFIYLLLKK
ncbi:iron complex transport system permease protein [Fontibacillus phaseoli]|uniref:Iron complex transport system permease protein n=1 Tax=Fontibacillus phaseoli TaxID=1416533 RepID=A0A369BB61_9BACL|nr:iron ABC transporter permease [Fontibacillus phaseoli]RCX17737.1 iron complex transport system permease protein [Fontibacillus phaseoli]